MPSRPHRLRISPEEASCILLGAPAFDDVLDPATWELPEPSGPNHAEIGRGEAMSPELAAAIGRLEDGALRDLIALILIGRGDFPADEWPDARAAAGAIPRERAAAYVAEMPLVGDFLEQGLAAFRHALGRQAETH